MRRMVFLDKEKATFLYTLMGKKKKNQRGNWDFLKINPGETGKAVIIVRISS